MGAWAGLVIYVASCWIVSLTPLAVFATVLATTQQGGGMENSKYGVESRRWTLASGVRWWTLP
jgi:hypothetical protein